MSPTRSPLSHPGGAFNNEGHIMAVGDAHLFPGFLTLVLTQLSFQSHRLLFLHAAAEVRGKNTPERKFASNGYRTQNHQVMSPTRSPLSHPGGAEAEGRANDELGHGSIDTACAAYSHSASVQSSTCPTVQASIEGHG